MDDERYAMDPLKFPKWFGKLALLFGLICQTISVAVYGYIAYLAFKLIFLAEGRDKISDWFVSITDYIGGLVDGDVIIIRYSTPEEVQIGILLLVAFYGLQIFMKGVGVILDFPSTLFTFGSNLSSTFAVGVSYPPETPSEPEKKLQPKTKPIESSVTADSV
jgi:hypothetical protein